MDNMKEKLSKLKDILVFGLSLEVNVLLTLFLFDVDIWGSLWQIARINIAILFFYGWLWFIDLYLNNYSTTAIIEKREQIKQGYVSAPKPKPEVAAHPKLKAKPAPAPEPAIEKPKTIVESAGETVKIQNTVRLQPDPIVEEPKPEPVLEPASESVIESIPKTIAKEEPAILVQEIQPKSSNHEQLMAWIEEEEGGEDNV